jgi:serine/threonine protein kinase
MSDRAGEVGPPDAASMQAFGTPAPHAAPTSRAGTHWQHGALPVIHGYRLQGVAGVGGLGVVFDAEQEHPRRRVAIKVIRPELVADERLRDSVLRRFEREVAHASRLHHPYILPVYDAGFFEEGGRTLPYLAMEFLEAPSLLSFAEGQALDRNARMELLAKVAEGVHYAHLNNVVHRDLKPSNIVVREHGMPAIRDFSLAWSRPQEIASPERMTAPDLVACTFDYAAPEQLAPGGMAGPASDIYALGVLGFELLTGDLPYDCDRGNLLDLVRAIAEQRMRSSASLRQRLGEDCIAVMRKAVESSPERRYQSAQAMAADLRAVLRGDRPTARMPTLSDDLRRFARRHRAAVAASLVLILTAAAGTATTLWQASVARGNARIAEDRSDRLARFADSVTTELATLVERLPSGTESKWKLVDESLASLETLAADSPNDPAIHETLAKALLEMARVSGDPSRANVGDGQRAIAASRRAIAICRGIPGFAQSARLQTLAGEISLSLAKILADVETEQAAVEAWNAFDFFRAAASSDPSNLHAQAMMGYSIFISTSIAVPPDEERLRSALAVTWRFLESACERGLIVTPGQAMTVMDGYDSLAWTALRIGSFDDAARFIDAAESALRPLVAQGDVLASNGLVNLGRVRAELLEQSGDRIGSCSLRQDVCRRFDALFEQFPDTPVILASSALAAREFAACAVRTGTSVDEATHYSMLVHRRRWDRDRKNLSARRHLEDAIRLRLQWLGESNPSEAVELRRELDALQSSDS